MADISTVLVIDDSIDIHRLLKIRLRDQNVVLLSAMSGAEGLTTAKEEQPDLILLDIDMPGMNGFEVLAALKYDPGTVEIPTIFLSGSGESTDKVRGFDLGAVDYITKPFDIAELRARVTSTLRTRNLLKMLAQRAQLDGLTGLWNRVHLDEQLAAHINSSLRHNTPLSVILCDIDKFKNLNDSHGHPFGDFVLQEFAGIITATLRDSDIACRYGGEEFAMILPNTDIQEGYQAAERCRKNLESNIWPGHKDLVVTASFGVTSLDMVALKDSASVLSSVDNSMYASKHGGRNMVTQAKPESDSDMPKLSKSA